MLIEVLKTVYDQTARMLSAMARTDYLSGNTTFRGTVLNSIGDVFGLNPTIVTCVHHFFVFTYSALKFSPLCIGRVSLAELSLSQLFGAELTGVARGVERPTR